MCSNWWVLWPLLKNQNVHFLCFITISEVKMQSWMKWGSVRRQQIGDMILAVVTIEAWMKTYFDGVFSTAHDRWFSIGYAVGHTLHAWIESKTTCVIKLTFWTCSIKCTHVKGTKKCNIVLTLYCRPMRSKNIINYLII